MSRCKNQSKYSIRVFCQVLQYWKSKCKGFTRSSLCCSYTVMTIENLRNTTILNCSWFSNTWITNSPFLKELNRILGHLYSLRNRLLSISYNKLSTINFHNTIKLQQYCNVQFLCIVEINKDMLLVISTLITINVSAHTYCLFCTVQSTQIYFLIRIINYLSIFIVKLVKNSFKG